MAMFGSTEVFFYRDLAGISPTSPGYKTITIAPQVVGDLTRAELHGKAEGSIGAYRSAGALSDDVAKQLSKELRDIPWMEAANEQNSQARQDG